MGWPAFAGHDKSDAPASPADRRRHQLQGILARPFGRPGEDAELATLRIDQERGRHAERPAHGLEILEYFGARVGVIGQVIDLRLAQPGFGLVRVAGVDVDRYFKETATTEPCLQAVECRRLL